MTVRPAYAIALDRLHAVMDVERIDGELSSDVNTPLRLNGLTMRSESTPSMASRSTMPSAWAMIEPKRTPLVTRSACASLPVAQASAMAAARIACKSAVISRARSSTRPAPISAIVCRSLENEGSMESNCALSKPSDTKHIGDVVGGAANDWIVVAAETGIRIRPLVRLNGGLTPFVAFGRNDRLGRLWPSGAVDGGELRLEQHGGRAR